MLHCEDFTDRRWKNAVRNPMLNFIFTKCAVFGSHNGAVGDIQKIGHPAHEVFLVLVQFTIGKGNSPEGPTS